MHMRKKSKQACMDVRTAHAQTTQPVDGKNTKVASQEAKKYPIVKDSAANALVTFQVHNIEERAALFQTLVRDLILAIVLDLAQLKITMKVTPLVRPHFSMQYRYISKFPILLVVMLKRH